MKIVTSKQQQADHAVNVQESEAQAMEAMAEMARKGSAEEGASAPEPKAASDDVVDGLWDDLIDEDTDVSLSKEQEELPDSVEEGEDTAPPQKPQAQEKALEASETEEVVDTTAEELVEVPEPPEQPQEKRTPDEVNAEVLKARETARDKLRERFKLTEQEEELFRDSPNEVVPRLVADLYLEVFDDVVRAMQVQVPAMLQQMQQFERQKKANEQRFFKAWPQLAKTEYLPTINRIADNYRAMQPNADPEQAVKEIGAQAWVALRLPLDGLMAHTQQAAPAGNTVVPMPPGGRRPPGAGKAASVNIDQPKKSTNFYEDLAEELLVDDG